MDIYNSFPACTHLRMNFLAKFSVAHKLKFLSHKAHAHLHSKLVSSSFTDDLEYQKSSNLSRSQLASTSFISHSQTTKNLVSENFQSISVKKQSLLGIDSRDSLHENKFHTNGLAYSTITFNLELGGVQLQ